MVEKYTLGIDIGTTGVKASVLDVEKGMIVAHSKGTSTISSKTWLC